MPRGERPTTTDAVDVSVLIPVRDEQEHVRSAASEMLAQEFDGELEFLFVDGRSEDSTRAILEDLAAEDQRIRILENPQRTTPQALNIALRHARGEYIARMDAHTHYPRDYLATGVARLRVDDGVLWASGPQIAVGAGPGSRRIALALSMMMGTGGARFRRASSHEFDVDTGFTGVWRRLTLEAHGGWDEEWLNDQDTELAARIRKAGGRIVCIPAMAASYIPRESVRRLAAQYRRYGLYRVKTARRHPESLRRSQLLPPAITVAAIVAVGGRGRTRNLARAAVAVYGATASLSSLRAIRTSGARDAVWLPAVYVTMHLSYGLGFLAGCVRYGPPLAGIAGLIVPAKQATAAE